VASYGGELAEKHARDTRILMNSDFYRELFPNTKIDVDRSGEIITTAGGVRKAISLGGAATGFGADVIVVDDITKASDANSEVEAHRAREFYDMTLVPRLNDQRTGKIIVLQQRLSENDLIAYLREKENFDILSLPATAQRSEDIPIYGGVHHRDVGDLLFPERDTPEVLRQLRQEMGARAYSAQYDQNPTPPGGNRIKWEWFGTYDFEPRRDLFQRVVQSWDTGHSEEPTSSFSVCMTWGWREGQWYLLDLVRGRWEYPRLRAIAKSLIDRWNPDFILIERASSGHSLFSDLWLRRDLGGKLRAIKPKVSKEERLEAATAELSDGKCKLPVDAPWLDDFRRECLSFPNGRNDDQVDTLSQFVDWQKKAGDHSNGGRPTRKRVVRRASIHRV
jgi:predicted phage terminase large subunit-like protein